MRFFFDNCISPKLSKAMHVLSEPTAIVVHLRDRFSPDCKDTIWLEALGQETGWIVVSGDEQIRRRPQERIVLKRAKLTVFYMASGFMNVPEWEQVRWLVDKWPSIREQARLAAAGSAFRVPKRGTKFEPLPVE